MEDQWVHQFEATVTQRVLELAGPSAPILIAVSGGPDSVCLARACVEGPLGRRVVLATVDHGLRAQSGAEAQFVSHLAHVWKVPHHTRRVALADGAGLEARARTARYQALEALRRDLGPTAVIATAHTRDDQAETVLMRLGRGSALRGAAGILPRRGAVLRPLLFASRADVLRHLRLRGVPWVTDAMNVDPRFTRVRLRLDVLPSLSRALGPGVGASLARFAELSREDDQLLQSLADAAALRLSKGGKLERVGFCALERPIARRVVARWLEVQGASVDLGAVEACLTCAATRRAQPLPGDRLVQSADGWLTVVAAPPRSLR